MILKLIAGPLIGALIGYCTNYIAVKMLFRPRKAVFLGGKRLPFTPGIIPKRKEDLARALGKAVGNNLLTSNDLMQAVSGDKIKNTVTEEIWAYYQEKTKEERCLREIALDYMEEDRYQNTREELEQKLTAKILESLLSADLGSIIVSEGSAAIREMVQGTMMAMMFNEQVVQSLAKPVGERVQRYLEEHGEERIRPALAKQMDRLEASQTGELVGKLPIDQSAFAKIVTHIYDRGIEPKLTAIIEEVDVAGIVENKVREMDAIVLEELILTVMKNELNAIVNLGALIGLIIGCLNLALNLL